MGEVSGKKTRICCGNKKHRPMKQIRVEALTKILNDLEDFRIDPNQYLSDAEPQGVYDTVLTGRINSLLAFCQTLGWSELVAKLQGMTPLGADALQALEVIQSFVRAFCKIRSRAGCVAGKSDIVLLTY